MRRPTIRLGYVMELVVAAAVCFAVVRSQLAAAATSNNGGFPLSSRGSGWTRLVGGPLLTGLAVSGGVGLAVEAIRGRRPSTWGVGRWIWSIAVFYMLFYVTDLFVRLLVSGQAFGRGPPIGVPQILERAAIYQFFNGFGWTIAAVCTVAMLARLPRDPEPDAREWAGRIFASLAVALNIAASWLQAAGH